MTGNAQTGKGPKEDELTAREPRSRHLVGPG
jgi:hypothetical protein